MSDRHAEQGPLHPGHRYQLISAIWGGASPAGGFPRGAVGATTTTIPEPVIALDDPETKTAHRPGQRCPRALVSALETVSLNESRLPSSGGPDKSNPTGRISGWKQVLNGLSVHYRECIAAAH